MKNTDKLDYEVPEMIVLAMDAAIGKGGGSIINENNADTEEGGELDDEVQ